MLPGHGRVVRIFRQHDVQFRGTFAEELGRFKIPADQFLESIRYALICELDEIALRDVSMLFGRRKSEHAFHEATDLIERVLPCGAFIHDVAVQNGKCNRRAIAAAILNRAE